MESKLLDRESNEFLALMRERNLLINAIAEIQIALNDPSHGAIHSDLWGMVHGVIVDLKQEIAQ